MYGWKSVLYVACFLPVFFSVGETALGLGEPEVDDDAAEPGLYDQCMEEEVCTGEPEGIDKVMDCCDMLSPKEKACVFEWLGPYFPGCDNMRAMCLAGCTNTAASKEASEVYKQKRSDYQGNFTAEEQQAYASCSACFSNMVSECICNKNLGLRK